MYEHVLVPTDGSEGTTGAVDHAISHANTYGATLHALYVVDTRAGMDGTGEAAAVLDSLEEAGQQAVDDVITQAEAAGVESIQASVARGVPHQAILDYAEDNDVDLIVMGTHGRTGIDRYLIGSVAEKVVRTSDAPVLTVRMAEE